MEYLIGYIAIGMIIVAGLSVYYSGSRAHAMSHWAILLMIFIWPVVLAVLAIMWLAKRDWY